MTDLIISTKEEKEEKKFDTNDISENIREVNEKYDKLKEENDKLEKELQRKEELRSKLQVGGRATAGQYIPEKTEQEKAMEEAKEIVKRFR